MQYSKNDKLKEVEKYQIFSNDMSDKNEVLLTVKKPIDDEKLVDWLFEKFIISGNYPYCTQKEFLLYCRYKENGNLHDLVARECKERSLSLRLLLDFRAILIVFAIHAINMFMYLAENVFLTTIASGLLCLITTAFLLFKFNCLYRVYFFKKNQKDFNEMYAYYQQIKNQNFMNFRDLDILLSPPGDFK